MSSDKIKDALVAAYPNTTDSQWKRRSKAKVAGGTERVFENATHSLTVTTVENPAGDICLGGATIPAATVATIIPATAGVQKNTVPKTATKAVSLRNQMVKGSVWVFDRDCDIVMWIENPERIRYRNLYHPRGGWGRDPKYNAFPASVERKVASVPAGTRFVVADKAQTSGSSWDGMKSNGLLFPVTLDENHAVKFDMPLGNGEFSSPLYYWRDADFKNRTMYLPYTKVEAFISPESIPESLVYVLRDSATGKFFGGWETETHTQHGYEGKQQTNVPKMVDKFSSAKKYKTNSAVKASIRDFTGYTANMDHDADSAEGWYGEYSGEKKIDLPSTWEMVAFDKPTATEKEIIDVQDWFKELMRLRVLTKGHGSAVRAAYKKAEGVKGLEVIIVFQNREKGSYSVRGNMKHYDNAASFEDMIDEGVAALAAIKEAAANMSSKAIRVKTQSSVAYACSLVDAFATKLAFDFDDIDVKVLDITTLEEIVETQPA